MKKTFLKVTAAVVLACLLLNIMPSLVSNTGLSWLGTDSLSLRGNFYFARRQWLADARTLVAAARYLYQTTSFGPTNSTGVVSMTFLPLMRSDASTNFLGLEETGPAIPSRERRLSRADSLIVRTRLLGTYGLLASDWNASNGVTVATAHLGRPLPPATNTAATLRGKLSRAAGLEGA
jgi:hypothetical protein